MSKPLPPNEFSQAMSDVREMLGISDGTEEDS